MNRLSVTDAKPSLAQLRQRVRHYRNHLNREFDAQESGFDEKLATVKERKVAAAIRRAKVHQLQAAFELAIAELQAHPDWRG